MGDPSTIAAFFEACQANDVARVTACLDHDATLASATRPDAEHAGWTALHTAARSGHENVVRVLLEHGADPNAREAGDNTTPLHWAAAGTSVEVVRRLLDAGSDVHGFGDAHALDVIGWATVFTPPYGDAEAIVSLLVDRGARHHIFSALAMGDASLIRQCVAADPRALDRRLSRFEEGQTPLHFAISRRRLDLLDLLIQLGANLDAADDHGHGALTYAIAHGHGDAVRRLITAGATSAPGWELGADASASPLSGSLAAGVAEIASSVRTSIPMIRVPDIAATLAWYVAAGFTEVGRHPHEGVVDWGMVTLGNAALMFMPGTPHPDGIRLWFYSTDVDRLYGRFREQLLRSARAALNGESAGADPRLELVADLHDPPYGGREFGVRDLNGYTLLFRQAGE